MSEALTGFLGFWWEFFFEIELIFIYLNFHFEENIMSNFQKKINFLIIMQE